MTETSNLASVAPKNNSSEDWNPWQIEQVHLSDLIVDKFQSWDKTQDPKPRLKAWNRAKKWVSELIKVQYNPPAGHSLRVLDKDNALQYLIEVMYDGTSFENFLRLYMIPPEAIASKSPII